MDPDGELPVYRFIQTDATFTGAEIEASVELWRAGERAISLEGAADIVRGRTDLGPPARIPPWSATARAVWKSPRLEADIEARHVARQDRIAAFELATAGYTLLNAKATFQPHRDRPLRLFVEGRNLTNQEAREHASFLKEVAPLPGRSVRAGVALTY